MHGSDALVKYLSAAESHLEEALASARTLATVAAVAEESRSESANLHSVDADAADDFVSEDQDLQIDPVRADDAGENEDDHDEYVAVVPNPIQATVQVLY